MKIGMTAGHGLTTAGKQTPDGEKEWSFNNKIVLSAIDRLKQYENVQVYRYDDPTGTTDIYRMIRVKRANADNIDMYIEVHQNANTGSWGTWGGTEVYTANLNIPETDKLALSINNKVVKTIGLRNRGLKKNNFDVLYFTKMPSVIVECAFMDSTTDIVKLRDDNMLKQVGIAIADGIAEYKGLKLKTIVAPTPTPTPPISGELYRIRKSWADEKSQIGAYANLDSAISMARINSGYNVYNSKGELIYPISVPVEPPLSQDELRRIRVVIKDIK